jgi:Domain of unknown function (DUF1851)
MDLIKRFADSQYRDALASWAWLDFGGKQPLFTSLFGDVFFQAGDGYWFLDTMEGTLTSPWQRQDEIEAALAGRDGQEQFLLASLASAAAQSGLLPDDDEVYDFTTPPVLGGVQAIDNLGVADFAVAVNICGQIHAQVRDLPPGTPIGEIKITPP